MSLAKSPRRYMGVRAIMPPDLQLATRAPTSADRAYVKGTLWLDTDADTAYMYPGSGDWISLGSGTAGAIVTLTGDSGGAISPVGGNIDILGTADQIDVVGTAGTLTISVPLAFIAPGSIEAVTSITAGTDIVATAGDITADAGDIEATAGAVNAGTTMTAGTGITATTGDIAATAGNVTAGAAVSATTTVTAGTGVTATTGNIVASAGNISATLGSVDAATTVTAGTDLVSTAGNVLINGAAKQLRVKGGAATDFIGQATLAMGTATVLNTNIAATDRIFVTRSAVNASTALGVFKVVITASTNFVITACDPADASTETGDESTVDYFIVRQL